MPASPVPSSPSALPSAASASSAVPSSVSAETLARTLRAVAAELERDPALARRVASAIADDARSPARDTLSDEHSDEAPSHHDSLAEVETSQPAKRRPARAFKPTLITGVSPDLGPGIPDPFLLAKRLGPDGLRVALADLRRGTLRAIIREYGIAPAAQVAHLGDDARLRELILAAVLRR